MIVTAWIITGIAVICSLVLCAKNDFTLWAFAFPFALTVIYMLK